MAEQVVEDPVLAQRYIFRRIVAEGGDVVQVDTWVDPGGGVLLAHIHPAFEERFNVLAGEITFVVGRNRVLAGPGEKATVAPGVRHAYRNTGQEQAHLICEVAHPQAAQLQRFLEDAAALNRTGRFTKRGIPTSFGALLQGAVLIHHYREMVVFTGPPRLLQWPISLPLVRLGERRGYRAGEFAGNAAA
jgi:mannose-6-phosphate isomerase-like protein (cupin superfamily)